MKKILDTNSFIVGIIVGIDIGLIISLLIITIKG